MLESNNYWRCPAIFLGGAGYCILVDPTHWSGEGCHLKACKGYSVAEGQSWPGVRRSLQGAGPLSSVAGGKRGHFLPTSMKGQCSEHGWSFFEIGVALRATQINRNKPVRGDLWGYSTWEQAPVLQLENPAISPWLLPGPTGVFFPAGWPLQQLQHPQPWQCRAFELLHRPEVWSIHGCVWKWGT